MSLAFVMKKKTIIGKTINVPKFSSSLMLRAKKLERLCLIILFGPRPTYDSKGRLLAFILNVTFKGQILKLNCLECQ